ncbi:DNA polymerase III subunit gamma/tau [Pseudacidovorax intermedius]|uniref:DNA polymerase III subunit gamma/tau n=1 Tax=Pseudacidovorax intermedius TaxID=433924 RepID=A0A147GTV5_9BURK|nr:DNA polymerase III subunit gamma/tau [Pseudacidovorax intermedius]KTT20872.1 DNA polymerase III subunits gamma and tau [Pseudacidovorax intermedius]
MSYLVLARKYRPRNFGEMVGQEHVVQALSNALTQQRLHHAYLFTGTRGVGKTTVSRILAKSLNCQGPDGQGGITATPCGVCQACTDIDAGRFVDYTELDAASNRGVDEVQGLLEQAVYKPVQGRFKVFMIDEVHMLTNTAFNAMLKTLEEPPEYLKFVLATTDPQKVPVTVLSRCLQFNLRPMAPETVLEHLTHVLGTEQVAAEPGALRLLSRAARGSMRDALSLTDQAIAYGNGSLAEAGVRQMLGSADRGHVHALVDALARGDGATVVGTVEAMRVAGLAAASTLEEMTAVLQAMAVLQAVPARAAAVDAADPDAAEVARLAATMPADETQLLYSICLHGRAELGLAPDEYAGLTMVLLRLLAFKPAGEAEKKSPLNAEARPVAAAAVASMAPVAAPVPAVASPTPPAPATAVRASAPGEPPALDPSPTATAPAGPFAARTAQDAPTATTASTRGVAEAAAAGTTPTRPSAARNDAAPPDAAHPVQRLPVVDMPARSAAPPVRAAAPAMADADTPVVAVPLRVQPPPGAREAPRESAADRIRPSEEGDFWHQTVMGLVAAEVINALARELALQSQLVARDVDQWLLRVERETLNQGSSRERLQNALAGAGHAVRLAIEVGAVVDSPALRNKAAAEARQRAAEQAIMGDPDVQALMRQWDARIVPGTLKPA